MSAANDAVRALQTAINRFAKSGGFSLIAVDGGMGANTEAATQRALQAAAAFSDEAAMLLATLQASPAGTPRQTRIMQEISDVTFILNAVASSKNLPQVAPPSSGGGGGGGGAFTVPGTTAAGAGASAKGFFDRLKKLPTWQQIVLAAGAAFGALLLHKEFIAEPKASKPVNGLGRRRRRR